MRDQSRILLPTAVLLLAVSNIMGSYARMDISARVDELDDRVTQLEKWLETHGDSRKQAKLPSKSDATNPASNAAEKTLFSKQAGEDIDTLTINWITTMGGGENSHELLIRINDLAGDDVTEIGYKPFDDTVRVLKSFRVFKPDSVLVGTVLVNGKEIGPFHATIPELEHGDIVIN